MWTVIVDGIEVEVPRYTLPPEIGSRLYHGYHGAPYEPFGPRHTWRVLPTGDAVCDRLIQCLGYDQDHVIEESLPGKYRPDPSNEPGAPYPNECGINRTND